jgi:hypothetical protein
MLSNLQLTLSTEEAGSNSNVAAEALLALTTNSVADPVPVLSAALNLTAV